MPLTRVWSGDCCVSILRSSGLDDPKLDASLPVCSQLMLLRLYDVDLPSLEARFSSSPAATEI